MSARDFIFLRIAPEYLEASMQVIDEFGRGELELTPFEQMLAVESGPNSEFEA